MKIELLDITVRELVEGYEDDGDGGVRGYDGLLDIRPPFQREFIYKEKERNAVIDSILKEFPLNVMYWSDREDGTFEIIDGQQRTISIAQYVQGDFSLDGQYFHNLTPEKQDLILDYKLTVYLCTGTSDEKLDWFRTINIAGQELTDQELRNAVYAGSWVSDAKRYFSRPKSPAYQLGKDYMRGAAIRQDYLEIAIKWIYGGNIEEYMAQHQHDDNAESLWLHFESVIRWVESVFIEKNKHMKSIDWGPLYDRYKDTNLDPITIEKEIASLMIDDEVTHKAGIYPYILTRDQKHLNIRTFTDSMRYKIYELQDGICVRCNNRFRIESMEADHITPWIEGGKTNEENCQMLCVRCNRRKSAS